VQRVETGRQGADQRHHLWSHHLLHHLRVCQNLTHLRVAITHLLKHGIAVDHLLHDRRILKHLLNHRVVHHLLHHCRIHISHSAHSARTTACCHVGHSTHPSKSRHTHAAHAAHAAHAGKRVRLSLCLSSSRIFCSVFCVVRGSGLLLLLGLRLRWGSSRLSLSFH